MEYEMIEENGFRMSWFAMGTEWQLQMHADHPEAYLRSIAEDVAAEVERVEQLLSFYRASSDVRELNATAGMGPVTVDPRLFDCCNGRSPSARRPGGVRSDYRPATALLGLCWEYRLHADNQGDRDGSGHCRNAACRT